MEITMKPIGYVRTDTKDIPRNWKVSDVEGTLHIDESYLEGLRDLEPGKKIYVLFHFHKSPEFSDRFMRITPPVADQEIGVFQHPFALPAQSDRPVAAGYPRYSGNRDQGQGSGHGR